MSGKALLMLLFGRRPLPRILSVTLMVTITISLNRMNGQLSDFYQATVAAPAMELPEQFPAPVQAKPQPQGNVTQTGTGKTPALKPILPNILIIGAQKAGSTALSDWLFGLGVCGAAIAKGEPPFYKKEMHFFDNDQRFNMGKEFYKRRFAHCAARRLKLRLDATPTTLLHPDRVYQTYKNVRNLSKLRIIVSLREPMARELSLYNHQLSQYQKNPDPNQWYATVMHTNETAKTFDQFVQTVTIPNLHNVYSASSTAYYAHYLQRWYQLFQPDQILVLSYQHHIRTNPKHAKLRLRQFLGLNLPTEGPFPETNTHATSIKVDKMSCAVRDQLHQIFEPWNQELYLLLANQSKAIPESQRPPPFPQFTLPDCISSDGQVQKDNDIDESMV